MCSLSGATTNSDQRRIFRRNFSGFFAYVEVERAAVSRCFKHIPLLESCARFSNIGS